VSIPYDRLLLGTGATPVWPPIHGVDLPGVFVLHTMDEGLELKARLESSPPGRAIIIGAGYIGVEMADAMRHRGFEVLLVGRAPSILSTLDADLAGMIETELREHGVDVRTAIEVQAITQTPQGLRITGNDRFDESSDLVLLAVGVKPNSALARDAGLTLSAEGAVLTNQRMQTALPHIYAAGDCAATWHRLLKRAVYLPLGTSSHKQGRVAGENAVGGHAQFAGSLGTQVVKVFDQVVGRTGLRHEEALAAGFEPFTHETEAFDHKAYYPRASTLHVRLTADRNNGTLLGAQLVGHFGAEVSKRLDVIALALHHSMPIAELSSVDLSYTPPLSSPWDALQVASQNWVRALDREGADSSNQRSPRQHG
jgi:NADPH-dependent 2,4-dienoyl-CoA reductase/sulfur reductase-like enzyme